MKFRLMLISEARRRDGRHVGDVAEVGIAIFKAGAPVGRKGVFDAAADRPAHLGVAESFNRPSSD
jgi:hypothetical protein